MNSHIFLGITMVTLTCLFHVSCLLLLASLLRKISFLFRRRNSANLAVLMVSIMSLLIIHSLEAIGWASFFMWVGEFEQFQQALYFSMVSFTTLGYGDLILSEQWQIIGALEAMGGLLMFGASTAFLIAVMKNLFYPDRPEEP